MAENQDGIYNLTKPVVMAFPQLAVAKPFVRNGQPKGEPKFKATFVFEPDNADLAALKKLALQVARAKWPTRDIIAEAKAGQFKFPFADGTKQADKRVAAGKRDGEWQRNRVLLQASSKFEPKLGGIENGKVVDYEGDLRVKSQSKFYPGVYVLAQVNLLPYVGGNGPDGVTAYLNLVFTTGKGARISGGGPSAAEVFKGYAGVATPEDPTDAAHTQNDLDDEIPF